MEPRLRRERQTRRPVHRHAPNKCSGTLARGSGKVAAADAAPKYRMAVSARRRPTFSGPRHRPPGEETTYGLVVVGCFFTHRSGIDLKIARSPDSGRSGSARWSRKRLARAPARDARVSSIAII